MQTLKGINVTAFIDVPVTAISKETKDLLNKFLLTYTDHSVLREHLYYLDEIPDLIPKDTPGYYDILLLHNLCIQYQAAYIRLISE